MEDVLLFVGRFLASCICFILFFTAAFFLRNQYFSAEKVPSTNVETHLT